MNNSKNATLPNVKRVKNTHKEQRRDQKQKNINLAL
jgi:hypothetical protein